MIFCGNGDLVTFQVAYKISKRLHACIDAQGQGVIYPFVFLNDSRTKRERHTVGKNLYGHVLVTHGAHGRVDIINVFQDVPVAIYRQRHGIGKHLHVVE